MDLAGGVGICLLDLEATTQFTAQENFSDASTSNITDMVTWASSVPQVAVFQTSAGAERQTLNSDRFSTPEKNPTTLSKLVVLFETPISFASFHYGV